MAQEKLTEALLKTLQPEDGQIQTYVWDTKTKGFGVVVGASTKTFVARAWVHAGGKSLKRRVVIGRHGETNEHGDRWTVELARTEALKLLGRMRDGEDPNAGKRRKDGPTLRDGLKLHVEKMERGENRRRKACSPRSIRTLRGEVEKHLERWLDRPITDLTREALRDLVSRIEKNAERIGGSNPANPPGRALANRLLAHVSAIWHTADDEWNLPTKNPAPRKMIAALKPRDNRISDGEIKSWHEKVMSMENPVRRDLQRVALFTGVRTEGLRNLRWDDVDFDEETIQIARAKGDRPYTLPMVATVREILEARQKDNAIVMGPWGGDEGYVFPSVARDGKTVIAVAEPKERRFALDEDGNVKLDEDDNPIRETYLPGIQACRKTFNSVAMEIGVPLEIRERLMNHAGRGVNVKSYGFPQDWTVTRSWADQIEAAMWDRIRGNRPAKGKRKLRAA